MLRSLRLGWSEISDARLARLGGPACSRQTATAPAIREFRQYGSRVPILPASPCFDKNLLAIFFHFIYDGAGRARFFVPRAPNEQLQENRRKVNPLLREPIVQLAPIRFFNPGGDNPRHLEFAQTIGQNVGGNPLARTLEFLECPVAANHKIANDQQRPAVSQYFKRDAYRTIGSTFGPGLPCHGREDIKNCLHNASYTIEEPARPQT